MEYEQESEREAKRTIRNRGAAEAALARSFGSAATAETDYFIETKRNKKHSQMS